VSIVKAFRFPASVHWRGGRLTRASAPGKPALEVATPPEFRGGVPGKWSPEELLVAATASCFALTLTAIARRLGVDVQAVEVDGLGHVEKGEDGRFRFVAIELTVELEGDKEAMSAAQNLIAETERRCIVGLALDVPVHVQMVHPEHARAPAST
jgi:organic hydroperoxide reductase OsmC/OhrA